MIPQDANFPFNREKDTPAVSCRYVTVARFASRAFLLVAFTLFIYGLAWNFSTRRYLKGFADAIIPLAGSPEERTEALLRWFRSEPQRLDTPVEGTEEFRDPVTVVQNSRLLKICGSASNAFINLAEAAGVKTRRLLLLDPSGGTMHVVAEVKWGDRWVVVNPQQGLVFKDYLGRALSKDDLRHPEVFRDAISRMPGYSPMYTFEHTIHIRLKRIPVLGEPLRRLLNRFVPGWEEAVNWAYLLENPSLWLIFVSLPLLLLGILGEWSVKRYGRNRPVS